MYHHIHITTRQRYTIDQYKVSLLVAAASCVVVASRLTNPASNAATSADRIAYTGNRPTDHAPRRRQRATRQEKLARGAFRRSVRRLAVVVAVRRLRRDSTAGVRLLWR